MSFINIKKLPTPVEIKEKIPFFAETKEFKDKKDEELAKIFTGEDDRFLFIIGPCSAHDEKAVLEYCEKLSKLQEQVSDKIFLLPRIYTNKPRTLGVGYKGMLHQPDPTKQPDMSEGIKAIREMHIKVISETGLTVADEMLYPENYEYLSDILSYVAVGARSVENQLHRLTISGLDIPAGMKNPTSGDLGVMLNSVQAAQSPHRFGFGGYEVETQGNPLAHSIMRGFVTRAGGNIPNYHFEDLISLDEDYKKRDLHNRAVIVDSNHSNSGKKFAEQPRIIKEIISNRHYSENLKSLVKGVMVESYLVEGAQPSDGGTYGQSITDPCIGWGATEKLILECAEQL
jgi:3-deoxy-7-phosphoheptulonate synthase